MNVKQFYRCPGQVSNCTPLVATAPECWIFRRVVLEVWWSSLGRLQLWKVRMDSNTPPLYRRCPALARLWAVRPSVVLASRVVPRVVLSVPPSPVDMLQETLRGWGRLQQRAEVGVWSYSIVGLCGGRLNWELLHKICIAA